MSEGEEGGFHGKGVGKGRRRDSPCRTTEIIKQLNKSTPSSGVQEKETRLAGRQKWWKKESLNLPPRFVPRAFPGLYPQPCQLLQDSNGLVSNRFRIIFGERILAERERRGSAGVMEETVVR